MTRRTPSLARRAFPALALTAVGVGLVQGLDRPAQFGNIGAALDPAAAGTGTATDATAAPSGTPTEAAPATAAPNGNATASGTPVATVAPSAKAPAATTPPAAAPATAAPVTAAPVTVAPATGGTCGDLVGTGAQKEITWRKSYGVIAVTAKFTAGGDLCDASAQWQAYDSKSQQYESYAVPVLNQQAEAADSASIQGVSGATAVSQAYQASLQSAIDNKR